MRWLVKMVLIIAGNAFALWLANRYIPGFALSATLLQLVSDRAHSSLLNFILKPILTLILGPVIVLTLGLGIIIVNAIIIYLLHLSPRNTLTSSRELLVFKPLRRSSSPPFL